MKKSKAKKIELLNKISEPEDRYAGWKKTAQWNRDHAESLEDLALIATRIIQTLKTRGMTQKELSEKLGVSPQALTRIVKGRQNLTLQSIRKIEKALDISLITVHKENVPVLEE